MIQVTDKLEVDNNYALSLKGDIQDVRIGDIVSDGNAKFRIKSVGMTHYNNPGDRKNNLEVLAEVI